MKSYCFHSGHIQFGVELPEGALLIAEGPIVELTETIHALARWSYPSKRGGDDEVPLVPGIPEADNEQTAVDAYIQFCQRVKLSLDSKLAKKIRTN